MLGEDGLFSEDQIMAKAIGIGDAFMKAANPNQIANQYQSKLSVDLFGVSNADSVCVPVDPTPTSSRWSTE